MPDTVGVPVLMQGRPSRGDCVRSGKIHKNVGRLDRSLQGIGDRYADPAGAGEFADILADT